MGNQPSIIKKVNFEDIQNLLLSDIEILNDEENNIVFKTLKNLKNNKHVVVDVENYSQLKKFSLVIEPGIEFFHNKVKKSKLRNFKTKLNFSIKNKFSFEAHSSDYQKENDLKRLVKHNSNLGAKSTKGYKWEIIYNKKFYSKSKALSFEYKLKKDRKERLRLLYEYKKKS